MRATPVAAETVDVWRAVAAHHPRHVNSFGTPLGRYANFLLDAGEGDLVLASAEEAEQVVRDLTVTNPGRASALLAALLDDLWRSYRATNQAERALELTTEALRLNRVLVERDAHQAAQLRDALRNHADLLDAVGLSTQAQAVRDELRAPGGVTGTVGDTLG